MQITWQNYYGIALASIRTRGWPLITLFLVLTGSSFLSSANAFIHPVNARQVPYCNGIHEVNCRIHTNIQQICQDGIPGVRAHPTVCNQFLNCANGITYVQSCGPGTAFNPMLRVCDHAYNVDCSHRQYFNILRNKVLAAGSRCMFGGLVNYDHPFNKQKFLQCIDGVVMVRKCPGRWIFDVGRGYCRPVRYFERFKICNNRVNNIVRNITDTIRKRVVNRPGRYSYPYRHSGRNLYYPKNYLPPRPSVPYTYRNGPVAPNPIPGHPMNTSPNMNPLPNGYSNVVMTTAASITPPTPNMNSTPNPIIAMNPNSNLNISSYSNQTQIATSSSQVKTNVKKKKRRRIIMDVQYEDHEEEVVNKDAQHKTTSELHKVDSLTKVQTPIP